MASLLTARCMARPPALRVVWSGSVLSRKTILAAEGWTTQISWHPTTAATRNLSTLAAQSSTSTTSSWWTASPRWRTIARWVRYTRIPLLIMGVYSLGYQQGVMDCVKTPVLLQSQLLVSILRSVGVVSEDDVEVVTEHDISWFSTNRTHQVAAVGQKIVAAARRYVDDELALAQQRVELPSDCTPEQAQLIYSQDDYVSFWQQARFRLYGEDDTRRTPWSFFFVDSPHPNAFVSEILPQRFFVTTAMLNVATTADELALVLGHEVSHLIYGHVSAASQLDVVLKTLQVLLLSLDPTEGVVALGVMGALATLAHVVTAAHSREHERQADDLGITLAARACFDTRAGVEVMRKMHEHHVSAEPRQSQQRGTMVQLLDSHPPSLERYEWLKQRAMTEHRGKYQDSVCRTASQQMWTAVWGQKPKTR